MVVPEEAENIINSLKLEPLLPEGGWFKRFWYKKGVISQIFYLLTEGDFSEFHSLPHQEQYIFLAGNRVEHFMGRIDSHTIERNVLGPDFLQGDKLNLLVSPSSYQALRLLKGGKWALMSTVMSPSYESEDYQSAGFREMTSYFSGQSELIKELTRF